MPDDRTTARLVELLKQRPPIKELNEALAILGDGHIKEISSIDQFFSKRDDFLNAVNAYLHADIIFRKEVRGALARLKKEGKQDTSGKLGVSDEIVQEFVEFTAKATGKEHEEVFDLVAKALQLKPSSVEAKYNRPSTHKNKRGKEKNNDL